MIDWELQGGVWSERFARKGLVHDERVTILCSGNITGWIRGKSWAGSDKSLGAVGYCSRKRELEAIEPQKEVSVVDQQWEERYSERRKNVGKTDESQYINFNMEATKQKRGNVEKAWRFQPTDLISCCRKSFYNRVLSQRRSPKQIFRKATQAAGQSVDRGQAGLECTLLLPLGSLKKNSTLCFLTGLPGAAESVLKKTLSWTCEVQAWWKQCKDWSHTSKVKECCWSWTFRVF